MDSRRKIKDNKNRFREAENKSTLPESINHKEINEFVIEMLETYLK